MAGILRPGAKILIFMMAKQLHDFLYKIEGGIFVMAKGLEGIKVVEVGGAAAMPLAGMLMGSWGAEVIHVEPPGRGDMQREFLSLGASGWARPHPMNYIWEHVSRNKKSIAVNMASPAG
jgi:crotonobetainyl-CoA:carnitine CoA-transferase CaiB-like acyl-CoA transferase